MKKVFIFLIPFVLAIDSFSQSDKNKLPPPRTKKNTAKGYVTIEQVARFPGGDSSYQSFLSAKLHLIGDSASLKNIKKGSYIIKAMFAIDTSGVTRTVKIESEPQEAFLESACSNMINNFPAWLPCIYNGRKVKTIRDEYFSIVVE